MTADFQGWAQALSDDQAFEREQVQLGKYWTLLGITHEVVHDGDWFSATLGGRSVFVQRFGTELKGFENRCAHRFYPLRTASNGNGPIVCGFHHWRYDRNGCAVGIPMSLELFGATPRDLNVRLNPVELAVCGSLIFGRFPADGMTETLEEYLSEGFPILKAISSISEKPHIHGRSVKANWKLCVQITLDDYHIVAVHSRPHYHSNKDLQYFRFGMHSAHFVGHDETLTSMAENCRSGRYRPTSYRIFNIFPNLAVSLFRASFRNAPHWYFNIQQFVPVSRGRCEHRGWFHRTEFLSDQESGWDRLINAVSEPTRARIVRYYQDRTAKEDHAACELLQASAHQIHGWPILGSQETRIGWFEEAYAKALN